VVGPWAELSIAVRIYPPDERVKTTVWQAITRHIAYPNELTDRGLVTEIESELRANYPAICIICELSPEDLRAQSDRAYWTIYTLGPPCESVTTSPPARAFSYARPAAHLGLGATG
jgi:hypothetical protein